MRDRRPLPLRLLAGLIVLAAVWGITTLTSFGVAPASATERAVFPAPADFVTIQYRDFLARTPDEAGLTYWSHRLEDGTDPGDLVDAMVSAPEFALTVAPTARLYRAYFLRSPDVEGLHFWTERLRSGWTLTDVSRFFAGASEFTARYGDLDDTQFIGLVYRNVLGRDPDAEGQAYWVGRLEAGAARGAVMLGFSESPEFVHSSNGEVRATMLYLGMLRRSPDPSGLAFWAGRIEGGTPYGSVVRGFLGSPEYQARMASLLPARHPLTGQATASSPNRPALALKMDAAPQSRPQIALNAADVVYEEMVEGNVTRFVAVFHARTPTTAGPVRSLRTTDFALLVPLDRPLIGASGANAIIREQLRTEPMIDVTAPAAGQAYDRVADRRSPHNLMATPARLWELTPPGWSRPPAIFDYRAPGEPLNPHAVPSAGVDVDFGRTTVSYRWTAAGWARTQDGTAHVDSVGRAITPDNVVVMQTDYRVSPADPESPEALTVGTGPAWIFTDGRRVDGAWTRASRNDVLAFVDPQGHRIELTPGTTWVELAPPGAVNAR